MARHRESKGRRTVNFQGSVFLDSPPDTVWKLLDDPEAVSRCIPGLDRLEVIDDDHFSALISQTVGPVTAVFAMKLAVLERQPGKAIRFDALGKTTRGAVSHLRTKGSVELEEKADGTRVTLSAEAALSGVLGTVGEKVLVKQSEKITAQFGEALRRELNGDRGDIAANLGPVRATQAAGPTPAEDTMGPGLIIHGLDSPWVASAIGLLLGFVLGRASKRARRAS
jgi:carbon monoxide dehydrogenase subunit G